MGAGKGLLAHAIAVLLLTALLGGCVQVCVVRVEHPAPAAEANIACRFDRNQLNQGGRGPRAYPAQQGGP